MAVTISGEARKFMVSGLPSFRPRKFRLYEVKMALLSPFSTPSVRLHCPIHGLKNVSFIFSVFSMSEGNWEH